MMAYSFAKTFDYRNAAGVEMTSDPLNVITLEPGLKFIGNFKNGWQPYAGVSMIWNVMDKTHYQAQNVDLPETSIRPYVQYGVGLKKSWGDRFTGWAQIALRNGGRNGVSGQLGFKYSFGKDFNSPKASSDVITIPTAGKINLSMK